VLGKLFTSIPCWAVYFPAALTAWPIWCYQKERSLIHRRAILDSVTLDDSSIRRWFWSGRVLLVLQVFVAFVWAMLLLAFLSLFKPMDWLVLGLDVLMLALVTNPVIRHLESQIKPEHIGVVTRMYPMLWLNIVLLALGFLTLDGFLIGAPNTLGLAWHVVAEQAYAEGSGGVNCRIVGMVVGSIATLDKLTWHVAQVLIPGMPHLELKIMAWGAVLLQAGILGYVFTCYQLGVLAINDRHRLRLSALSGESTFPKAFVITIVILAAPYLYVAMKLQDFDPKGLAQGAGEFIKWANPCKPDLRSIEKIESELDAKLNKARIESIQRADRDIDAAVNAVFADVEKGVDSYLDWYFTVTGEYQRLAALAAGNFADTMGKRLEQHLFGETRLGDRLEEARQNAVESSNQQLTELAGHLAVQIRDKAEANPCQINTLDLSALGNLNRDRFRAFVAAGGGVPAGIVTGKVLAKKAATGFASKLATTKGFKAVAGVAGKVLAKKGGSVALAAAGATAICSPGGPLAVVCGVVAGGLTWIGIDKAMIKIDEMRFREEMRAEILSDVHGYKNEIATALKFQQHAAIDQLIQHIHGSVGKTFLPIRDGI